jgi:hypothetical protein
MMNASDEYEYLPTGTGVLNTNDGQPGVIMNGFAYNPATGWTGYEVETQHGIERWQRADIVLMLEFEDDERPTPFSRTTNPA